MFQNRLRSDSRRLPDWDYTTPGAYFVTIGIKQHRCYFGMVVDGEMQLNPLGEIAEKYWKEIPLHHNNVELDEFVIMPNHIHRILILIDSEDSVETLHVTSLRSDQESEYEFFSRISPKKGSLSTIIRSYKSTVTRMIRKFLDPDFAWQSRYYDHVLMSDKDLENLRLFIQLNPENWRTGITENIPGEAYAYA
jgi:putative transposase